MRLLTGDVFYGNEIPADAGTPVSLKVSGVGVFANEVVPFSDLEALANVVLTPEFGARVAPEDRAYEGANIVIRRGAEVGSVRAQIEELAANDAGFAEFELYTSDLASQAATVQHGLRPLSLALGLVALVLGLVGLLLAGQAVARHVHIAPTDAVTFDALGLTARQRAGLVFGRAVLIGAFGALGAVAVAIALSPRFPIGVARVAEPNPGVQLAWIVLAIGVPAIVLGAAAMAMPTAISAARGRRATTAGGASRVAAFIGRSALPTPVVQGVRFALEPGAGPTPVPVRSSLLVAAVAVAAVVASFTYATSLRGLLDTGARYGQRWDVMLDGGFSPAPVASVMPASWMGSRATVRSPASPSAATAT
jgi:hypothetical protein